MAVPLTLSSGLAIVSRLTAKTQIAFVSSVPSVYSVGSVVSLLLSLGHLRTEPGDDRDPGEAHDDDGRHDRTEP